VRITFIGEPPTPTISAEKIIELITAHKSGAHNNITTSQLQLDVASTRLEKDEAKASIQKAYTQAVLLANLLAEINGEESIPLWKQ